MTATSRRMSLRAPAFRALLAARASALARNSASGREHFALPTRAFSTRRGIEKKEEHTLVVKVPVVVPFVVILLEGLPNAVVNACPKAMVSNISDRCAPDKIISA